MTEPRRVNKELERLGIKDKLYRNVRGGCYYYFSGDEADSWTSASIFVFTLRDWTTDEVIKEYHRLKALNSDNTSNNILPVV